MAEKTRRQRARRRRRTEVEEETPEVEEQEVEEPEPEEEVEEPEPESKPAGRRGRRSRRSRQVAEEVKEPEPEEEVEEPADRRRSRKEDGTVSGQQLLKEVFSKLEQGWAVTIARVGEDEYLLSAAEEAAVAPPAPRKVRRVPREVFFTEAYSTWLEKWSEKTYEDKLAYADKHGIEWDAIDFDNVDPDNVKKLQGIDAMRISIAVWKDELGIQKYKDGFQTVSQRRDAKAKLEIGLDVEGIEL